MAKRNIKVMKDDEKSNTEPPAESDDGKSASIGQNQDSSVSIEDEIDLKIVYDVEERAFLMVSMP